MRIIWLTLQIWFEQQINLQSWHEFNIQKKKVLLNVTVYINFRGNKIKLKYNYITLRIQMKKGIKIKQENDLSFFHFGKKKNPIKWVLYSLTRVLLYDYHKKKLSCKMYVWTIKVSHLVSIDVKYLFSFSF